MLLKSESVSKQLIKLLEFWSTTSVAKLNESLTVCLLVATGFKIGTKNFAGLYIGVCKADKIGLKDEQTSTHFCAICKNRT